MKPLCPSSQKTFFAEIGSENLGNIQLHTTPILIVQELLHSKRVAFAVKLEKVLRLHGKAAYCIPVLSDASDAFNVMEDETPADQLPEGSKTRILG